MKKLKLTTAFRSDKIARDEEIYAEHEALMLEPYAMATVIADYLMKKHNICSPSTIWQILKKVRLRKDPAFAKKVYEGKILVSNPILAERDNLILQEFTELAKETKPAIIYQRLTEKYMISRPAIHQAIKRARLRTDPEYRAQQLSNLQND